MANRVLAGQWVMPGGMADLIWTMTNPDGLVRTLIRCKAGTDTPGDSDTLALGNARANTTPTSSCWLRSRKIP